MCTEGVSQREEGGLTFFFYCGRRWPLNGGSIRDYLWNICVRQSTLTHRVRCVFVHMSVLFVPSKRKQWPGCCLFSPSTHRQCVVLTGWLNSHALLARCRCVQRGNSYYPAFMLFILLHRIPLLMPGFNTFTLIIILSFFLSTPIFYLVFHLLKCSPTSLSLTISSIFPCHLFICMCHVH